MTASMRGLAGCIVALQLTACAEWPRWAHVDDSDSGAVPAGTDPRSLVSMDWTGGEDVAENQTPVGVHRHALTSGRGVYVSGVLVGTGWREDVATEPVSAEACGSEGVPAPGPGAYTGDVDFFIVEVPEDTTLCAELHVDSDLSGWDLVPFDLDDCDIPSPPWVDDGGDVVGYSLGGEVGGWSQLVDRTGAVAVLVAGYDPVDTASVTYNLGVSVVPNTSAGGPGLCPLLPTEPP